MMFQTAGQAPLEWPVGVHVTVKITKRFATHGMVPVRMAVKMDIQVMTAFSEFVSN